MPEQKREPEQDTRPVFPQERVLRRPQESISPEASDKEMTAIERVLASALDAFEQAGITPGDLDGFDDLRQDPEEW